jgi:4-alpha-glucanotransferase
MGASSSLWPDQYSHRRTGTRPVQLAGYNRAVTRRRGLLLPLFSAVSTTTWGIGDFSAIAPLARWMRAAGLDDLMLLPVGTMADDQSSPYSACSAMAIDPLYIPIDQVPDFQRAGGRDGFVPSFRAELDRVSAAPRIDYAGVRLVKHAALSIAFTVFVRDEWLQHTVRAAELAAFIQRERWWLDDYALYRVLARRHGADWRTWPAPLAERHPDALDEARRHLAQEVLGEQYWQWLADLAWRDARAAAREAGVAIYGDVPFVVDANSADVWARPGDFLLDLTAGVPPDAFSATGQDWGLPVYRWDAVAAGGFQWLKARARRAAALFDGIRLDHLVGFYRTYARAVDGRAWFIPSDEHTQRWQGEQVLSAMHEAGVHLLAEDLGVIPDFVRASLVSHGVPGYKVVRWERRYDAPGQPFIDPAEFPAASVAATGTHDTETMAAWYDGLSPEERRDVAGTDGPFDDRVRDELLSRVWRAGSAFAFIPMQDLFGWRDRINTPATVGPHNWTWRLPWPIDAWREMPETRERAQVLATTPRS